MNKKRQIYEEARAEAMRAAETAQQPISVGLTFPGHFSDAEIRREMEKIAKQNGAKINWINRFNPDYGGPVFYVP